MIALLGSTLSLLACYLALEASGEAKQAVREQAASRRNGVALTCREGNEHHARARGFVVALVAKTPRAPTRQARKIQREVAAALKPGAHAPRSQAARRQLEQIALFVEAIAPQYNCAERIAKLTAGPRGVR